MYTLQERETMVKEMIKNLTLTSTKRRALLHYCYTLREEE